jgi:hypothetical protein
MHVRVCVFVCLVLTRTDFDICVCVCVCVCVTEIFVLDESLEASHLSMRDSNLHALRYRAAADASTRRYSVYLLYWYKRSNTQCTSTRFAIVLLLKLGPAGTTRLRLWY